MRYHPEKIPSAIERYQKEILRVLGVLESVLSKQEWLVGGKLTIADLSFIPYVSAFSNIIKSPRIDTGCTAYTGGTGPLSTLCSLGLRVSTSRRSTRRCTSPSTLCCVSVHALISLAGGTRTSLRGLLSLGS